VIAFSPFSLFCYTYRKPNIQKILMSAQDTSKAVDDEKMIGAQAPFDSGLKTLREQVKNVMIPLLIHVFQMKLQAQQMASPPSRLQAKAPMDKAEDLREQLTALDDDLKMTMEWLYSARNHIEKILIDMESKPSERSIRSGFSSSPNIQKSFSEAMTHKQSDIPSEKSPPPSHDESPSLWHRIFGR
jgi:hypothetical protein